MEDLKNKKVLIVGLGKTGFSLIHFFNTFDCEIKVTDIKPIFDLNKQVKKVKRIDPAPELILGEHRQEDFLDADIIVYSPAINPNLPQLEAARMQGKTVYSEFELAYRFCKKPIIAVCGSVGRTSISHMIAYILKKDGKNSFVCGSPEQLFIDFYAQPEQDSFDYVVAEVSAEQLQTAPNFHPHVVVYNEINENFNNERFLNFSAYAEAQVKFLKNLTAEDFLVLSFDKLSSHSFFREVNAQTFWYSRKSFVKLGVLNEVQGTHFHERRIHSNIHYHSEFRVSDMRIIGAKNRENLLAAITVCKALKCSDEAIQETIKYFPGIPHRLEFVMEKNGVSFYNDSKSETMYNLKDSLSSIKSSVILIAGGKDTNQNYEGYEDVIKNKVRSIILIGECKENMNRFVGNAAQTFLVGSFDESVLIAYQKSRTGDIILLSPGNSSADIFRDYEERGNYYKKLVFQL